jgi:hypothetical protein
VVLTAPTLFVDSFPIVRSFFLPVALGAVAVGTELAARDVGWRGVLMFVILPGLERIFQAYAVCCCL